MKLKEISLTNYKGIDKLDIALNGKTTVFCGINGSGKTTILNAISCIFGRIITSFSEGVFKPKDMLLNDDIQYGKSYSNIRCVFTLNNIDRDFEIERTVSKKSKIKKINKPMFDLFIDELGRVYEKENGNVPVMVNYGTNRTVLDIPLRIRNNHSFESIYAYENAFENKIDFRNFFMWFRNQEDYESEIKTEKGDLDYRDKSLECVRHAICFMLDGFSNLRVQRNKLRMTVSKNGTTLNIDQLSDGEKCTLALIGDLARRVAVANPKLENPLHGDGIVLIDEIELHMHTRWQRKIINKLRELFPNIQFIITTHSPQVLGELDDNYNIFMVDNESNEFKINRIDSLIAWDSNLILEELMNTASLNIKIKGKVDDMYSKITKKSFDEAESIADELDVISNGKNADVVAARTLIRRGRARI